MSDMLNDASGPRTETRATVAKSTYRDEHPESVIYVRCNYTCEQELPGQTSVHAPANLPAL